MTDTSMFHKTLFKDLVDPNKIDSPIEEEFYRVISKHLDADVEFANQPAAGVYSLDFLASKGDLKVAFECDGKEFHNQERDERRDLHILSYTPIHSIVRVRGTDINFRIYDSLYVIASWYPELFSGRGLDNIERLATPTAKNTRFSRTAAHFVYNPHDTPEDYELDSDEVVDDKFCNGFGELFILRRLRA